MRSMDNDTYLGMPCTLLVTFLYRDAQSNHFLCSKRTWEQRHSLRNRFQAWCSATNQPLNADSVSFFLHQCPNMKVRPKRNCNLALRKIFNPQTSLDIHSLDSASNTATNRPGGGDDTRGTLFAKRGSDRYLSPPRLVIPFTINSSFHQKVNPLHYSVQRCNGKLLLPLRFLKLFEHDLVLW